MGYKLNDTGWEVMSTIAPKLNNLGQGESLVLKDTRGAIDQLRHYIYSWLYETEKKPDYKVIRRTPTSLEVRRKYVMCPTILSDDKVDNFVSCNLIEVGDEPEATRRIREAVQRDELTTDEGIRALSEWQRVQGRS